MRIEKYLNQLKEKWDYTPEELEDIRTAMLLFSIDVITVSQIEKEVVANLDEIQNNG